VTKKKPFATSVPRREAPERLSDPVFPDPGLPRRWL
jgi:hypothetical protein